MKFKIVLLLCITCNFLHAQTPLVKQWDAAFGGSASDELRAMEKTNDGGYILGGWSSSDTSNDKTQLSRGGFDFWIVKINAAGTKQWDARFGGAENDYLLTLKPTADGGFILGGSSTSGISGDRTQASRGGLDFWIIKIDSLGTKQWDAAFGGIDLDVCQTLQQTNDGGYILGGSSASGISGDRTQLLGGSSDYWIVKVNSLGVKQWDAAFGGGFHDELSSIQITSDGGFMLAGYSESGISGNKTTASRGGYDYWLVKVNSNGAKQWEAAFGGDNNDYLECVELTNDGGYILGGLSYSGISNEKTQANLGNYDYWVVKIDGNGIKQWDAGFGGVEDDRLYSIVQSADGGYMLAGKSRSDTSIFKTQLSKGEWDYWIIKINSLGIKLFDVVFGGNSSDDLSCMVATADGGYMFGGCSWSDISGDKTQASKGNYDYWVVKTSATVTLPLQLITFSGIVNNNDAVLAWQTANEINTSHFNIQSSSNGREFANAGVITSINNNSHQYNYTDKNAFANSRIIYYRLQMVNKDGSFTYSNIIQLEQRNLIVQLQVYPNPVLSSMRVSIEHYKAEKARLQIINSNGVIVKQQTIQLVSGRTTATINATELPPGIYFILVKGEGLKLERKFIKQ